MIKVVNVTEHGGKLHTAKGWLSYEEQMEAQAHRDQITAGATAAGAVVGSPIFGLVVGMLLAGPGHRPAAKESYGEITRKTREWGSAQANSSRKSGIGRNMSTMQNVQEARAKAEAFRRGGGLQQLHWSPMKAFGKPQAYDPKARKITGSVISERRDRGKFERRNNRNENFKDALAVSQGPDKGSGNAAAMEEMYSTAETRQTGFNSKDFTNDAYKKNFTKLQIEPGTKYLNPALKDMFNEKQYRSDVGLVRRVPRRYL